MRKILFIIFAALLVAACGIIPWRSFSAGPMMGSGNDWWGSGNYDSIGERIYFTATNEGGEYIRFSGSSSYGGMMGGDNLSCVSCHGPDGRGGTHTMHMDIMDAPDIRFDALSDEVEDHGEDDHSDTHGEYDFEDFYRAVVEGKHPDGEMLSHDMPRWQMNDEDLGDLFDFVKSLP